MDFLSSLQNLLGQAAGSPAAAQPQPRTGAESGLAGLLDPNALGGLLSALLSGKQGGGRFSGIASGGGLDALGGLLGSFLGGQGSGVLSQILSGGGAAQPQPSAGIPAASPQTRATTLLRSLVYAAKADGHIDAQERAAINGQIAKLGLGAEAERVVNQAIEEPLDPNRVAADVGDVQEAAQIYALSCVVTNMDQFMERSYLDGLASALRISPDAKAKIEARVAGR